MHENDVLYTWKLIYSTQGKLQLRRPFLMASPICGKYQDRKADTQADGLEGV